MQFGKLSFFHEEFFDNCVIVSFWSDTAAKLQATKQKAGKANDTAREVLARLKDMNQNLMGLNRNYSKLKDDINKANNLIQDPEKNSVSFFLFLFFF